MPRGFQPWKSELPGKSTLDVELIPFFVEELGSRGRNLGYRSHRTYYRSREDCGTEKTHVSRNHCDVGMIVASSRDLEETLECLS